MTKRLRSIFPVIVMLLGLGCRSSFPASADHAIDANRYYAVLLNNGAVYFGKLQGMGTAYPVLRDVFYIQSTTNPETKAVSNVLVKRGKDLHGPDRMFINDKSIVII